MDHGDLVMERRWGKPGSGCTEPLVQRIRDLTLLRLDENRTLVVACDSSGGIGPKEADSYPASARDVAHFACRVALLEVIAAGAQPLVVIDNLCVEAVPTGASMIEEVKRMVSQLGLDPTTAVSGSTEDNVETRSTGIGVTVIGAAATADLRPGTSQAGDIIVCLGVPLSAPRDDLRVDEPRLVTPRELVEVLAIPDVHDVLPVGSRGIAYETHELARLAGLAAAAVADVGIALSVSCGPATCVLLSCAPQAEEALRSLRADLPITVVATLDDRRPTS